jgi:hypothetical protein
MFGDYWRLLAYLYALLWIPVWVLSRDPLDQVDILAARLCRIERGHDGEIARNRTATE